jgi:HEAT repeat protein
VSDRALLSKIVRLLGSDAVEKQMAAALVLGELGAKDPAVVDGLIALLGSPVTPVQREAAIALGAIGSRKALPALLGLLGARDTGVREATADAVVSFGEEAIPMLRARLAEVPGAEKRPLEELLARLGGRDALSTLLGALGPDDLEAARAAVLPLRQRLKEADARERKRTLEQALKFLESGAKGAGKKARGKVPTGAAGAGVAPRMAALKVVGYVGDPGAASKLLAIAQSPKEDEVVREEAVIALRMSGDLHEKARALPAKTAEALVALAEKGPSRVARAALYSLAAAPLPAAMGRRLAKLAGHAEAARALIAVELLGAMPGRDAADALAHTLIETTERARAEAAATALAKRAEAGPALARALLETRDRDRADMVARLLRPHLGKVERAIGRQVIKEAVARVEADDASAESMLQVARALDADATADGLRDVATRLRKARKFERALEVLRVLGRSREAAPDDGYALAALELTHGLKDEAFTVISQLADQGYDVGKALRKDRSLEDRHRYEIGFHFIEQGHPLGEEALSAVAESAGRSKLGQMARAKLKSAGL